MVTLYVGDDEESMEAMRLCCSAGLEVISVPVSGWATPELVDGCKHFRGIAEIRSFIEERKKRR